MCNIIIYQRYNKFFFTPHNLKNTLNLYGVAIIPNVLNHYECNKINEGMWDFFEHISNNWSGELKAINRNDVSTWKGIYQLYPLSLFCLIN